MAGQAAWAAAGGGRRTTTAFDRVELIGDALIALLAHGARLTVIMENAEFGLLVQVLPGLQVLFYDRHPVA